jgi:hypothetical protein
LVKVQTIQQLQVLSMLNLKHLHMQKNKPLWTLIGFVMFGLGVLSIILSLVGLKLDMLGPIYNHGVLTFIIQLVLLFGGMIVLYIARTGGEEDA